MIIRKENSKTPSYYSNSTRFKRKSDHNPAIDRSKRFRRELPKCEEINAISPSAHNIPYERSTSQNSLRPYNSPILCHSPQIPETTPTQIPAEGDQQQSKQTLTKMTVKEYMALHKQQMNNDLEVKDLKAILDTAKPSSLDASPKLIKPTSVFDKFRNPDNPNPEDIPDAGVDVHDGDSEDSDVEGDKGNQESSQDNILNTVMPLSISSSQNISNASEQPKLSSLSEPPPPSPIFDREKLSK